MRFYTSYTSRRHNNHGAAILAGDGVHTRGWDAGVRVTAREAGPDGKTDAFDVYATTGSHESGNAVHIGTVTGTPDGPRWQPQPAAPPLAVTDDGQVVSRPDGPTAEDHGIARNALQTAIDALLGTDCGFWACDGPDAPFAYMATCQRCAAIQDLRAELARLTRR